MQRAFMELKAFGALQLSIRAVKHGFIRHRFLHGARKPCFAIGIPFQVRRR